MDETNIPSRDDDHRAFQQLVAATDGPAYARRARRVHDGFEQLLQQCRIQREELLPFVRLSLGTLHALAGSWDAVRPCLQDDESLELLLRLHDELQPRLRVPVAPTTSIRALKRTLLELIDGLERFNRRWRDYVQQLDLTALNELRDGYNRYYVLEKECALRNAAAARFAFQPLPPLMIDDILQRLPPFGVPQLS